MNLKIIVPVIVVILIGVGISLYQPEGTPNEIMVESSIDINSRLDTELQITETNGVKHVIPLDKIKSGGHQKTESRLLTILCL